MVSVRFVVLLGLLVAAMPACAPKEDVTPAIVVSPGAKERIMVMDRFRHHGSPRRILPRVTVEEVDEEDLPPLTNEEPSGIDPTRSDVAPTDGGGAVAPSGRSLPAQEDRRDQRHDEHGDHEDGNE